MANGHMAAVLVSQDAGARKIPRRGENLGRIGERDLKTDPWKAAGKQS